MNDSPIWLQIENEGNTLAVGLISLDLSSPASSLVQEKEPTVLDVRMFPSAALTFKCTAPEMILTPK